MYLRQCVAYPLLIGRRLHASVASWKKQVLHVLYKIRDLSPTNTESWTYHRLIQYHGHNTDLRRITDLSQTYIESHTCQTCIESKTYLETRITGLHKITDLWQTYINSRNYHRLTWNHGLITDLYRITGLSQTYIESQIYHWLTQNHIFITDLYIYIYMFKDLSQT